MTACAKQSHLAGTPSRPDWTASPSRPTEFDGGDGIQTDTKHPDTDSFHWLIQLFPFGQEMFESLPSSSALNVKVKPDPALRSGLNLRAWDVNSVWKRSVDPPAGRGANLTSSI
ncbi:hypothetical protein SRHO_G00033880 [Serrasalmus rhombeus]